MGNAPIFLVILEPQLMYWLVLRQLCPRPQRTYEARIGLEMMEEQASKTACRQQDIAKRALEVLAARAAYHFAHLQILVAVMNCTFCRTSMAGRAVINWVLTMLTTNSTPPYPFHPPLPRLTRNSQPSGRPRRSRVGHTAEVSLEPLPAFVG